MKRFLMISVIMLVFIVVSCDSKTASLEKGLVDADITEGADSKTEDNTDNNLSDDLSDEDSSEWKVADDEEVVDDPEIEDKTDGDTEKVDDNEIDGDDKADYDEIDNDTADTNDDDKIIDDSEIDDKTDNDIETIDDPETDDDDEMDSDTTDTNDDDEIIDDSEIDDKNDDDDEIIDDPETNDYNDEIVDDYDETDDDEEIVDEDFYVDPCNPNPCEEENKTVCTDDNFDGVPECGCDYGYVFEEGLCIDTKLVACVDNPPANGTSIQGNVTITWTGTEWTTPADCEWECNDCYVKNESFDGCVLQPVVFVDKSAAGDESGTTWENAKTNLSNTIEESCDGQQIWVAGGIYIPKTCPNTSSCNNKLRHFTLKNTIAIYGGFNGTEIDIDERDVSANETILSGDINQDDDTYGVGENAYNVFYHKEQDIDETAILDGFTITAGTGDYGGGIYNYGITVKPTIRNCTFRDISVREDGAAIYNYSSTPTIINCTFKNNFAKNDGGAIYNKFQNPKIISCTFDSNFAQKDGGAVYNYFSSPEIINSFFENNSSDNLAGAVYNWKSSPTITSCTFENNLAASNGGAVYNYFSSPKITDCLFENNSAYKGGALYNYISNWTPNGCMFKNNSAIFGGAVSNEFSDTSLLNCSFEGNFASKWGGAVSASKSDTTIINSAFKNNFALENGGAVFSLHSELTFINSTFLENHVNGRGGVVSFTDGGASLIVQNTVMWGNTAVYNGNNIYWDKEEGLPFPEISHSNIGGCGTSGIDWKSNNCGTDGGGNIDTDPLFVGGETHPLMISPYSPCRDAGNDSYISETEDISGNIRNNGTVDMGAYEMPCDNIPANATTEITWDGGNPVCGSNWECGKCFTLNDTEDACLYGGFDEIIYVDKSATGNNSGESWEDAETDLSNAIYNACQGQKIWVASGNYTPTSCPNLIDAECEDDPRKRHFTLKNGIALYGGFAGHETALEERDVLMNETFLSGDFDENDDEADETTRDENAYHVFFHKELNIDETAVLDGFTVANGRANGEDQNNYGGAFYNYESIVTPTISNLMLKNNFAQFRGGAVYNYYSNVDVGGITFYRNYADYGGAVYNEAGNIVFTECTFDSNSTVNSGGAFYNTLSGSTINNCIFKNNAGNNGGAVYNDKGNIAFIGSTFNGNSAIEAGGAVYNDEDSGSTITNCIAKDNYANSGGFVFNNYSSSTISSSVFENNSAYQGGVLLNTHSDIDIANSIFKDNSAHWGGAIINGTSNFVGTNCIFEGNTADIGGAIRNSNTNMLINNCTVTGNSASMGAIYASFSIPEIRNTIIRGENALYANESAFQISYSNIEGCGTSDIDWNVDDCGTDEGGNIDADPLFIGTGEHPLMLSALSQCVDAGYNDYVSELTDILGSTRIVGGTVDMGAYEVQD